MIDRVALAGVEIAYRQEGSGDPILFINGTGESGATWGWQTRALADRWRCIAIDNRDTGDSTYVDEDYTPREMAADAAGVIDALDLGACHVVGYSLGGATAQELALARPDIVRSLALIATWHATDGWFEGQMRSWQSIRLAHWNDEPGFERALAPWLFAPRTYDDPSIIERIYHGIEQTPQRPEGWMRQTEADIAHDTGGRLREVRAPALVLVGAEDICTPPRYSRALCELIPQTELVVVEDAGHAVVGERADEVNAALADFLSRR